MEVVIDIIGVMPDPAEMNRYFSDGWFRCENVPPGPIAFNRMPGSRLSSIQRVPIDPSWALTVIVSEVGRDGEDDTV